MTYYEAMLIHLPALIQQIGYDRANELVIQQGKKIISNDADKAHELALAWVQCTRGKDYQDIVASVTALEKSWARGTVAN